MKWNKRSLALALGCVLCLSLFSFTSHALDSDAAFADIDGHYAQSNIQTWSENGILQGYPDGTFRPDNVVTRAEFSAVASRLMGYRTAGPNNFSDLPADAWFTADMLLLSGAGVLQGGDGSQMFPQYPMTRQEVFVAMARLLSLPPLESIPARFPDAGDIAPWALGAVSAMVSAGYLRGDDGGALRPAAPITRGELACLLSRVAPGFLGEDGVYTLDCPGNLILNAGSITLENTTVAGDLIVADGVADGDISLRNVTVRGSVLLRGCGEHSFHLYSQNVLGQIIVSKSSSGAIRVVNEDGQLQPLVVVADGQDDVILQGDFADVSVNADVPVTLRGGQTSILTLDAPDARVTVEKGARVLEATVTPNSPHSRLTVDGALESILTQTATQLDCLGSVGSVSVHSDGLTLTGYTPQSVALAAGVARPLDNSVRRPTASAGSSSGTSNPGASCTHDWDITTIPSTCITSGSTTKICKLCGAVEFLATSVLDADLHQWVENDDALAPTCTTPGHVATKTCKLCGINITETGNPSGPYVLPTIPATGHNFGSSYMDPVLGEARRCAVCGYVDAPHAAIDPDTCTHDWNVVTIPETCIQSGSTTKTCKRCGAVETVFSSTLDADLHQWVENNDALAPTCTTPGHVATKTCKLCGINITQTGGPGGPYVLPTIPATGHSFSAPYTDPSSGKSVCRCVLCGAIQPVS